MLTKNIYILYPPGYSGSYVSWAINVSDADMYKVTTSNPINSVDSNKYGTAGTSHLHHRIPTHQGIEDHMTWMVLNRPVDKKIFVINTDNNDIDRTLSHIVYSDRDPVIILIHDGGDWDTRAYGSINGLTKWPIRSLLGMNNIDVAISLGLAEQNVRWDPFDCATDLTCRNTIALGNTKIIETLSPIENNPRAMYTFLKHKMWYEVRNQAHPHEVNSDNYLYLKEFPSHRLHQISCLDVVSDYFPDLLNSILSQNNTLSDSNFDYVKQYQSTYISAQSNLQWFDSIAQWREQGIINAYLNSHAAIQGFFIRELVKKYKLPVGWDMMNIQEIADKVVAL